MSNWKNYNKKVRINPSKDIGSRSPELVVMKIFKSKVLLESTPGVRGKNIVGGVDIRPATI